MDTATGLDIATKQLQFARGYSSSLLADIDDADWFRVPAGFVAGQKDCGDITVTALLRVLKRRL